jgi:hypothetical protein
MNLTSTIDHVAQAVVLHGRAVVKATPALMHSASEFVRNTPNDPWAMSAFAAAASIMVTLVTAHLWPRQTGPVAAREKTSAATVLQLAALGMDAAEIARRTGMSHDAVATILRATALRRGEGGTATRKSQPSAA